MSDRCKHEWWFLTDGFRFRSSASSKRHGVRWCKCCGKLKIVNSFGTYYEGINKSPAKQGKDSQN